MDLRLAARAYVVALVVFLLVDGAWIVLVAGPLYDARMPALVREDPLLVPAGLFYVAFVAVLVHLAVRPGLAAGGLAAGVRAAAGQGAVVGATAYGTYALTALAVVDGFSTVVAVVDLVWGGVLGAAVAAVTTAVVRRRRATGA